jgi:hypothetical protein
MDLIYNRNTEKICIVNSCNSNLVINDKYLMDEEESKQFDNLPSNIIDNFSIYYGDLGYELFINIDIELIREYLINVNIYVVEDEIKQLLINDDIYLNESDDWYMNKITGDNLYSYSKKNKIIWLSYNILLYFNGKFDCNSELIEYICEAILVEHYKWKVDKIIL